ncbi:MAG: hypothetical protein PHI66_03935 [Candidatus Pacebacteria bacterium]|nr:hypothetical protein [Candidatus Paceibacterota bacterium]
MVDGTIIENIKEIPRILEKENVKQPLVYLGGDVNGERRMIVLVGEIHIASKKEEKASDRILPYFHYIGCEGVDVKGFVEGRIFFFIMDTIINPLLNIFYYLGKRSVRNKSSIRKAQGLENKKLLMLEKGWKPSIRTRIFFITIPTLFFWTVFDIAKGGAEIANSNGGEWGAAFIAGIIISSIFISKLLHAIPIIRDIHEYIMNFIFDYIFDLGSSRNRNMIENLITELNRDKLMKEVLILTGAQHTIPLAKILKKKYNFIEKRF